MTDKEKYEALVAEIEHQKKETSIGLNEWENDEEHGRMDVINALQKKIKFMQGEPVSDELEKVVEEIVDPTVLNSYGVKEIANRLRRTIIESVSEEQVKESLISKHEDKTCKENGNSLTQEPVSEDLEKVANQSGYAAYPVDMAEEFGGVIRDNNRYQRSSYIKGFIAGANWQKEQILDCNTTLQRTFNLGKQEMKQQMMAKAVDAVVSQVPCSNEIILRNPASVYWSYLPQEMNKLGLNKGDKVKVIVIKED